MAVNELPKDIDVILWYIANNIVRLEDERDIDRKILIKGLSRKVGLDILDMKDERPAEYRGSEEE